MSILSITDLIHVYSLNHHQTRFYRSKEQIIVDNFLYNG